MLRWLLFYFCTVNCLRHWSVSSSIMKSANFRFKKVDLYEDDSIVEICDGN